MQKQKYHTHLKKMVYPMAIKLGYVVLDSSFIELKGGYKKIKNEI